MQKFFAGAPHPGRASKRWIWGCAPNVSQSFAPRPRTSPFARTTCGFARQATSRRTAGTFRAGSPLATETPFRVTMDLHLGDGPAGSAPPQLQAEVFKQEWETFRDAPQPWRVELSPDRLFLLPD
jgi:molybdate transport system permease protein